MMFKASDAVHDVLSVCCCDTGAMADANSRARSGAITSAARMSWSDCPLTNSITQKRHRAAYHAESVTAINVLMAYGCGRQRFLAKPRTNMGSLPTRSGRDHFDGVRCFKKDMPGLKNHSHAALAESSLQLVARIEDGFGRSAMGVVASPSCGQWLTSSGKQRLQAGHSFIY